MRYLKRQFHVDTAAAREKSLLNVKQNTKNIYIKKRREKRVLHDYVNPTSETRTLIIYVSPLRKRIQTDIHMHIHRDGVLHIVDEL